jgi:hypothetical protein
MPLSAASLRFFDAFGFLVVRGLLRDDIGWITAEFDRVWSERDCLRNGHAGSHSVMPVVPFIDQSERLCALLDHPLLEPILEQAVGPDFNYLSGDGRIYHGDTTWHWDGECPPETPFYKVAIYLDPLTRDTGALRVIPGSHRLSDTFTQRARWANKSEEQLGIPGCDVPCTALETVPGDVVLFHHNICHGSFGGDDSRRMFAMNVAPHAVSADQFAALKGYLGYHLAPWGEHAHGPIMRKTATPNRMRHLSQVMANEQHLPELYRAAQARQAQARSAVASVA